MTAHGVSAGFCGSANARVGSRLLPGLEAATGGKECVPGGGCSPWSTAFNVSLGVHDLLVVEDKGGDCGVWSRAWPVGFIRAGGAIEAPPTTEAPPEG